MSEKPGRKKGLINENSMEAQLQSVCSKELVLTQNTLLSQSAQLAKTFGKYWKKGLTGRP